MEEDLRVQLEALERSLAEFEAAARIALGYIRSVEFCGVTFNVSRRFVMADLAPLAFVHLVERIETTPEEAVIRLHERVAPLLTCRHQWTPLRRARDEHMRNMTGGRPNGPQTHTCKHCTAYALEGFLPKIGRAL
jgi:hypothetical protein